MAKQTGDPCTPNSRAGSEDDNHQTNDFMQFYGDDGENARAGLLNGELALDKESGAVDNFVNISSEYLSARNVSQVPYEYQPTLIQLNDSEKCTDYHFGLIRGYHKEMYNENKQKQSTLCGSWESDTSRRIRERNRVLSWQVAGVIFGGVFVFLGIIFILVSFMVSWYDARDYFWQSLEVLSAYNRILAIAGLTVLSLGSALVSLCLLVPVCMERVHGQDVAGTWCTLGDFYVKSPERAYNVVPNQFLYFDAAVFRKKFGKTKVKRVQPEIRE